MGDWRNGLAQNIYVPTCMMDVGAQGSISLAARVDVGLLCVALSAQCFGIGAALTKYVNVHALLFDAVRAPLLWLACFASALSAWKLATASRLVTNNASLQDTLLHGAQKQPALDEYIFGSAKFRLLLFLRGLAYWAFELFWFSAVMNMPIGDATCIAFSLSPLLSGLIARVFLGQALSWQTYAVGGANILGMALVLQPTALFGPPPSDDSSDETGTGSSSTYGTGVALAIACACCASTIPVMTKRLAPCHWTTVEHVTQMWRAFVLTPVAVLVLWAVDHATFDSAWQMLVAVVSGRDGSIELARDGSVWPRPHAMLAMIGSSVVFYAALTLQIYGYQRATHTQRANMTAYLEILTAFLFQRFLFRDEVGLLAAIGAVIIAGAGIANVAHKPTMAEDDDTGAATKKACEEDEVLQQP